VKNGRFRWEYFVAALVLSLGVHVFVVVPYLLAPLVEKPDVPLEVAIEDAPASGEDSTAAPETPKLDAPKPEPPKPEEKLAKAPEPATVEPPKPKPKPEPESKPEPTVLKPVELPKQRMKMVQQRHFDEEEPENTDAHFLGEQNHRAKEETQARETNLVRDVDGADRAHTEPNQNKGPDVGGREDKVAELQERPGVEHQIVRSPTARGDEQRHEPPKPEPPTKSGPLSMRDLTPRAPSPGERARDGLELPEAPGGTLPSARVGRDAARARTEPGGGSKLGLNHQLYDQIIGADAAERERRAAAKAEVSHKAGRYERYLAKREALRSSVENFLGGAVKPGNQTELGTRAFPFAGYITAMHRQIHKLFADGFLNDIERSFQKTHYDNMAMWAKIEIAVNPDGTVHKASIVRASGLTAFDAAALDAVMTAAPYPVPPKAIRSADDRVYVHWQFHRDPVDACGTHNVDPYILTTIPDDKPHDAPLGGVGSQRAAGPKRLEKAPEPTAPREVAELPSSSSSSSSGAAPEVTLEARTTAEGWFAAYARGDAAWLAGWSATPFSAAGEVVARDAKALKHMYRELLDEAPAARKVEAFDVLTPAGIRAKLGGLPPGGEDEDMLFAVGRAGGEEFILLLQKSTRGWRVSGIDR
jgi:TonB family protein